MSTLFATIIVSATLLGQTPAEQPVETVPGADATVERDPVPNVEPSSDAPAPIAEQSRIEQSRIEQARIEQAKIEQAIENLGSDRFIERKVASQQLWRMGLDAEPALREAVASRDREVRTRAERILSDFDFGIIPGVPANVLMWIRQFRAGDPSERQAAFARLLNHQHFEAVERLFRLERDANVRRTLLVRLFRDENAVERFIELDRVELLIKTVGADQDERWRRTMMASVLSAPRMLTRLIETGKLNVLLEFIENESDAILRKQLLQTILQTPGSVAALIKNNQLDFTFTILKSEADKAVRGELLLILLNAPEAVAAILEEGKLDQILTFAKDNSDSAMYKRIFEQLFRTPNVVARLLETPGYDAVIKMVAGEQDPKIRGELLANLMVSRDMQKHLSNNGQEENVVTLAKEENDVIARRAYLDRLFQNSNILYSLKSNETLRALWDLVKSDPDHHWRTVAISRMLVTSRFTQLLNDEKEIEWLLSWLVDAEQQDDRGKLLMAIINNYSLRRKMLQQGHFGQLFTMVKQEPEAARADLLTRLMSSSDAAKFFKDKEKADELITLASGFNDAKARHAYVTGLFRNHWAMSELVKHGHYEALAVLAKGADDAVDRAILYGDFVRTQPVIDELKKNGELDSLIELATGESNQAAQYEFLKRLYSNQVGLGALIEAGHFETLLKLAEETKQPTQRNTLLVAFYGAAKVVAALIEDDDIESLLAFVKSQQDPNARRQLLQRLYYNQQAITALVDKGHFETLLSLATAEKHPSYRASMIGALLGSPPVVKYLAEKDKLGSVLNLVTRETDASSRDQLLAYILSRSSTVTALVENGFLPSLLKLIDQSTGSRREQMLGQVLLVPKVLELLAKQKRLSMVLSVAETSADGGGRTNYVQNLFYNSAAMNLLINHGYFDNLLTLSLSQKEPTFRATLLGRLFALELATQQLVKNNRVDFFLTTLKAESSVDARRNLLTQLVKSKYVMAALIEAKQIDALITLCLEDKDDAKRRVLLSELLASPNVLAHLASTNRLGAVLTDVLAEQDQAKLRPLLERLLTSSESMRLLTKHMQMERLVTLIESRLDEHHRKALLSRLANNRSGIEWLARAGKTDMLMAAVNDTVSDRRGYLLRNILYTRVALEAMLANGHFDAILKHIGAEDNDSMRRSMMSTLLFSPATLEFLARSDRLGHVFKLVTDEADNNFRRQCIQAFLYRTEGHALFEHPVVTDELLKLLKLETTGNQASFLRQMMVVSRIRQGIVRAGKADVLRDFIALEKDKRRRAEYLRQLLFSPSGVVTWHIQRGEYDLAEARLVEHATDDRGRIRWAGYLRSRNLLDARVAALKQSLIETPAEVDQRQLLYLLRAQGDISGTYDLANQLGDNGLLRAVLVERQAWEEAAALQSADACPLPVPVLLTSSNASAYQEIEALGYLASFQRLAGARTSFNATIKTIQDLRQANSNDEKLAWHCAEALMLNDRVDLALEFIRETHPRRAFALYTFQHRYDEAFELVGLPRELPLDRAWFDALHGDGANKSDQLQNRFHFALHVARVFDLLGQADQRDALLALLTAVVEEMPTPTNGTPPANAYWEYMSQSLLRMDLPRRAWEIGARAVQPNSSSPSLLSRLYGRRYSEASAWWTFLRDQQPNQPVAVALDHLHRILTPRPTELAGEFSALSKQAELHAETMNHSVRASYLLGIATTCRGRGETVTALRLLEVAGSYGNAEMLRADLCAELGQPLQAARLYAQIWEKDKAELGALYLSGHAFQQAGRDDEASHHKQLAHELAIDSRARHTMAAALAERGLMAEAIEQWKFLRAAAPFEHWEVNDAARRLALAEPDQENLAADRWQHYMLGDLRNSYYMLENEGYLRVPTNVHRLRALAAVQSGDLEAVRRYADLAIALTPGDTTLAEVLAPALDQIAQEDQADQIFDKLYRRYETNCQQFPASAYLHNNLAWLAARCDRQIDASMRHATQADELAPENGSYLATLAEVHFRQGNREAAVRYSRKAVKSSPDRDSLREQLARFENDPLPTP